MKTTSVIHKWKANLGIIMTQDCNIHLLWEPPRSSANGHHPPSFLEDYVVALLGHHNSLHLLLLLFHHPDGRLLFPVFLLPHFDLNFEILKFQKILNQESKNEKIERNDGEISRIFWKIFNMAFVFVKGNSSHSQLKGSTAIAVVFRSE